MSVITVILDHDWNDVYNRVDKGIEALKEEGLIVKKDIDRKKRFLYINYTMKDSKIADGDNLFKYHMADILSDAIINEMEEKIAYKILSSQHNYFNGQERKAIIKHFKKDYRNQVYKYTEGVICTISRKAKMFEQIREYLDEDHVINIEGFARFRLRDYIEVLENNIDKAVEDFLMEKEYYEFIRLLKYFVDVQESKIDTVHVLMSENGKYKLYDDRNKIINNEDLESLAEEMADKDISYDDLLISSLITLAPKKIVLHVISRISKKEIFNTIRNVFSDKVSICSGCNLCLVTQNVKQE